MAWAARTVGRPLLLASILGTLSCTVSHEPTDITLDKAVRFVSFGAPVQGNGSARDICLVGEKKEIARVMPRGGASVRAVLVTAEGYRDTLHEPAIERRFDGSADQGFCGS